MQLRPKRIVKNSKAMNMGKLYPQFIKIIWKMKELLGKNFIVLSINRKSSRLIK
jgi:hypothetical protein